MKKKKTAKLGPIIYESDEDEYCLREEISLEGSAIKERIIHETAADGRQITKRICTLEGTQYEEVEEWESTQTGEKKNEKHSKRTTPSNPLPSKGDKKPSPAAEAALKALVSQEIVIVPGHTKVEFDEKNNIKTITEKTTSGHQVTTIQTFPDGRTKTQTRTFYDPISVPVGEDEEYEEEEEEEIIEEESWEPKSSNTQVTSTNQNQQTKNVNQQQVTRNTSDVSTQQQQQQKQTSTQQTTKQVSQQQQTTVTQQTSRKTTSESQVHSQSTTSQQQQQHHQQSIQNTQNKQVVKKDDNTNKQVAVPSGQPRTTIVKKKLDTGEEIEIHTTISADGLSKTCRRIVTQPAEELEVTEYEETTSYEPNETRVRTTSQQTTTKKTSETTQSVQQQHQQHEQTHHQQQQTIKNQQQTNITDQQQQQQLKNVDTKNPTAVAPYGQEEFVAAQHSSRRTKVTESVTMIVQDEHGTSGVTKTKQTVNKEQNVHASQTGKQDLATTRNQTTVSEEEHALSVEEIERLLQRQTSNDSQQLSPEILSLTKDQIDQLLQHHTKTTQQIKQTQQSHHTKQTTQQTSTLTQDQVEELKRLQQIKNTQQTTQQSTQQTTQQTTQQKSKVTQEQLDKQEREMRQQLEQQKQKSNVDQRFTKNQDQTIRTETHKITHTSEKTFTTSMGHVVERPNTLPDETTTEEVRYFPGGVEYVWKTVRSDGSSKMSMRTFYDPVPVECNDEEDKKKLPAAHASNVGAQSGLKK